MIFPRQSFEKRNLALRRITSSPTCPPTSLWRLCMVDLRQRRRCGNVTGQTYRLRSVGGIVVCPDRVRDRVEAPDEVEGVLLQAQCVLPGVADAEVAVVRVGRLKVRHGADRVSQGIVFLRVVQYFALELLPQPGHPFRGQLVRIEGRCVRASRVVSANSRRSPGASSMHLQPLTSRQSDAAGPQVIPPEALCGGRQHLHPNTDETRESRRG